MIPWLFPAVFVWLLLLIAVLAASTLRAGSAVDRALALETLSLIFIAELAVFAIARGRAAYLDVALMLALVSFVQTVASTRYAGRGVVP